MELEQLKERVSKLNWEIAELGLKTVGNDGKQKMEYWLPDELKQLMIEEFNRPDEEKTHIAIVKYFCGNHTWWFSEYDDRGDEYIADFFGLCKAQFVEYGYSNLKEMRDIKVRGFITVERDYHFTPEPLEDIRKRLS